MRYVCIIRDVFSWVKYLNFSNIKGDIRNDLYLTLERGEFERGGKSVQKNIEVTLYVLYADGDTLKVCCINTSQVSSYGGMKESITLFCCGLCFAGLHQFGQRGAKQLRVSLICPLPQQQPALEWDGQVTDSHRSFQRLPSALWVQTLL